MLAIAPMLANNFIMKFQPPKPVEAIVRKSKELANDISYDIQFTGNNIRQAIDKVRLDRNMKKLKAISKDVFRTNDAGAWQSGESTIKFLAYRDKYVWNVQKRSQGVTRLEATVIGRELATAVTAQRYGPDGILTESIVVTGNNPHEWLRGAPGVVAEVVETIGSAERLAELPPLRYDA